MKYLTTRLTLSVHRSTENPIFGEGCTQVRIEDEGAGAFVVLSQVTDNQGEQTLRLDLEELEAVLTAAQQLMQDYQKFEQSYAAAV